MHILQTWPLGVPKTARLETPIAIAAGGDALVDRMPIYHAQYPRGHEILDLCQQLGERVLGAARAVPVLEGDSPSGFLERVVRLEREP